MAKIIDWFPKIIFCAIPEIIMLMIPNAGIINSWVKKEMKEKIRENESSGTIHSRLLDLQ